jgi:hypothetical protein
MKKQEPLPVGAIGRNRAGIPVFSRATKAVDAEYFNGLNEEGKPTFMRCKTIVSLVAYNR